jgi:Phosphotransferase enzyme family
VGGRRADDLDGVLARLEPQLGTITAPPAPLEGGITNRNFRVRFGERECVVRLPGKDTGLLGISRQAERIATQAAAGLGIAPRLLAFDDQYLVSEYVEGSPAGPVGLRAGPEPVGLALRRFHDSGVELPIRFWVPELLEAYADVVLERGGRLSGEYAQARELAGRIGDRLPLSGPVPCHDDLLPGNILRLAGGEDIMLVDWEYAGMGHRFFDLGNLAVNHEFEESHEVRLLTAYLDREPSAADHASLRLMRIMSDAREAAWGVVQASTSDLEFDFDAYAARHFARLAEAARDPRLEVWLDAATA